MQVLDLLRREGSAPLGRLAANALIAGLACTSLLAITTDDARASPQDGPDFSSLGVFIAILLLFWLVQRRLLRKTTDDIEAALHRLRTRLFAKARDCEVLSLEAVGRTRIFSAITTEAETIATSASGMLVGAQSLVLIGCILAYIAYLSLAAFVLVAVTGGFALVLYVRRLRQSRALRRQAFSKEDSLRESLSPLLDGFKEVKLSAARGAGVEADFEAASDEARRTHVNAENDLNDNYVLAQLLLFGVLGVLTFIVPGLEQIESEVVAQLVIVTLFVVGPTTALLTAVPRFLSAEASAERLGDIEQQLEVQLVAQRSGADPGPPPARPRFAVRRISVEQLQYRHRTGDGVAIGPVDFSIEEGQTLLITGDYASGKSTLLKLLAGVYLPDSGSIVVDGRPVGRGDIQSYREQIAAVFDDHYLFPRLYGVEADPDDVATLLLELEIDDNVTLVDGRFDPLPTSPGQRKRLALVSAILERRPILLLDEWASDQEPHLRRVFYERILPRLKRRGTTVIAAANDAQWFNVADRRIHLEAGKIVATVEGAIDG